MSDLVTLLTDAPQAIVTFVTILFTVAEFITANWNWLIPVTITIIVVVILGQIMEFWVLFLSPFIWLFNLRKRKQKEKEDQWLKDHLAHYLEAQEDAHIIHNMEHERVHAHYDVPKKHV